MEAAEEPLPAEEVVEAAEEPSPDAEREEVVVAGKPSVDRKRMRKREFGRSRQERHEIRHDFISDCLLHLSLLYAHLLIILNPNRKIHLCTALWLFYVSVLVYPFSIFTHYYTYRVPLIYLTEKGGTRLLAVINRITPIL